MILTCPNCGTQYVVKDGAIPPEGRHVRCAACKHSWHQDPEEMALEAAAHGQSEPAPIADTGAAHGVETAEEGDESLAEATMIDPRSGPEAEERAYEGAAIESRAAPAAERLGSADLSAGPDISGATEAPPAADWNEPPTAEPEADTFSPFVDNGEIEPKRRGASATIFIVALVIIIVAALFWFFAPAEIKAKLGLVAAGASPLALVTTHMDRQKLESGNELLTVTGRVINPTAKEQDIPPLQAQLKSRAGKLVKSWTIPPPVRSLPAGASTSFNSAEVNVPPGADELTITLGGPKA